MEQSRISNPAWTVLVVSIGLLAMHVPTAYASYEPDENGNPIWVSASGEPEPAEGPDWSDADGNNLPAWLEEAAGAWGTADDDGDGMANLWEVMNGLDPEDASDAAGDPDNDFLLNVEEAELGTLPTDPETVLPGVDDLLVTTGIDAVELGLEVGDDFDGDGITNAEELELGTDPRAPQILIEVIAEVESGENSSNPINPEPIFFQAPEDEPTGGEEEIQKSWTLGDKVVGPDGQLVDREEWQRQCDERWKVTQEFLNRSGASELDRQVLDYLDEKYPLSANPYRDVLDFHHDLWDTVAEAGLTITGGLAAEAAEVPGMVNEIVDFVLDLLGN